MAPKVGAFTPAQRDMVYGAVKDYLTIAGFIRPPNGLRTYNEPTAIYVSNTSGEEIPAWACMQCTGTVEYGGQNYIEVDKPADADGSAGWFLFNGQVPIEIDGYGIAQNGTVVRMLTDGSTIVAGERWSPVASSWQITDGGNAFVAIGSDDIGTNIIKAFSFPREQVQLRISGYDFQISYDGGTTWETWATGAACP